MRHPDYRQGWPNRALGVAAAIAASIGAVSCQAAQEGSGAAAPEEARPTLGLMTSLPLYWGEPAGMADILEGSAQQHWVRAMLEEDYTLAPLDVLGSAEGRPNEELARMDRLLVAQPRALTAADNVALDAWVRAGGRLLLVLDPMITDHSDYHVGDKRRFNDVALIPPLLGRWGLGMRHAQGAPPRQVAFAGALIPVDDYGILSAGTPPTAVDGACVVAADGIVATCSIGDGQALIVADAAFLNREGDLSASSRAADAVFTAAFD